MKRIIAYIIAGAVAFGTVGCGQPGMQEPSADSAAEADVSSDSKEAATESSSENAAMEESGPASGEASSSAADSAAESELSEKELRKAQDEELTAEDEHFSLGSVSEGRYLQPFFKMQADLADSWSFYDEEQMSEANLGLFDGMDSKEIKHVIDGGNSYIDIVAVNGVKAETFNVSITRMPGLSNTVEVSEYVETVYPQLTEQLTAQGLSNIKVEKTRAAFAGQDLTATRITADSPVDESSTYPFYELQVYVKQGRYLACVTATSIMEDTTAEVLKLFTACE